MSNSLQLRFGCNGRYITLIKSGKLTRRAIEALIEEAQKRNLIVDLSGRDLSKLDLSKFKLGRANMSNTDLSNSNLSNSTLFDVNLSGSIEN